MSTIFKCDECGQLGKPGQTWISVSVSPHHLPGNQQHHGYMEEVAMPSLGASGGGPVCSANCAVKRLTRCLRDVRDFADDMIDSLAVAQEKMAAAE